MAAIALPVDAINWLAITQRVGRRIRNQFRDEMIYYRRTMSRSLESLKGALVAPRMYYASLPFFFFVFGGAVAAPLPSQPAGARQKH
jgi:hypothetical protein